MGGVTFGIKSNGYSQYERLISNKIAKMYW